MLNKLFGKSNAPKQDDNLLESLYGLIRNLLDHDQVVELGPDTKLADLGFDSIKYIHLLLSLEDVVGADLEKIVSEIDLNELQTISDISAFITKLKN